MKYILIYLLSINFIGYLTMLIDKNLARRHMWRVYELVIFLYALFGGGIGVYAGMYSFRHKTKKKIFTFGVPAIIILETIMVILVVLIRIYR